MFAMSQALFLIVSYTSVHLVLQPLYEVGAIVFRVSQMRK